MYKISIQDRNYQDFSIYCNDSLIKTNLDSVDPLQDKLFNDDVFIKKDEEFKLHHSMIRNMKYIAGILVLEGNKTYGKVKNKYLYKCVPDDKRLPLFLIPYELKTLGFSKVLINKYIVFNFENWDNKFPVGKINVNIGDVNIDFNFYEYELYCKSLYNSISKFNKEIIKKLTNKGSEKYLDKILKNNEIKDLTNEFVFTIDSNTTTDFDDAFSIIEICDSKYILKIHIANVPLWIDSFELWDSFTNRISTIYLPDKKRPMIPTILSENLCSLKSGSNKVAFTLEIHISNNTIVGYLFYNSLINVNKNFVYQEKQLLENDNYKMLLDVFTKLSDKYNYIKKINNSYDVVTYGMILMNYYSSLKLVDLNCGIFKSSSINSINNVPNDLDEEMYNFLKIWNSSTTQYCLFNDQLNHVLMNLESYVHITSPIRRLVDMLNMVILQQNTSLVKSNNSQQQFIDKWCSQLDYINTTMRAIKKVQRNCELLNMCLNDENILQQEHNCFVFDKLKRSDELIQYMIYNKKLQSVAKITTKENLTNYNFYKFKIYLFQDEANLKKKIRYHLLKDN